MAIGTTLFCPNDSYIAQLIYARTLTAGIVEATEQAGAGEPIQERRDDVSSLLIHKSLHAPAVRARRPVLVPRSRRRMTTANAYAKMIAKAIAAPSMRNAPASRITALPIHLDMKTA